MLNTMPIHTKSNRADRNPLTGFIYFDTSPLRIQVSLRSVTRRRTYVPMSKSDSYEIYLPPGSARSSDRNPW